MAELNMKAFLKSNAKAVKDEEYIASERFVDEQGNPIPWKLRILGSDEIEAIERRCKRREFNISNHEYKTAIDKTALATEMVCAAIVFPNLNDADLQASYGTVGASLTVKAMLTPNEYRGLVIAVLKVSGYKMLQNETRLYLQIIEILSETP